jgi:hypothetical protein
MRVQKALDGMFATPPAEAINAFKKLDTAMNQAKHVDFDQDHGGAQELSNGKPESGGGDGSSEPESEVALRVCEVLQDSGKHSPHAAQEIEQKTRAEKAQLREAEKVRQLLEQEQTRLPAEQRKRKRRPWSSSSWRHKSVPGRPPRRRRRRLPSRLSRAANSRFPRSWLRRPSRLTRRKPRRLW